jgi:hypothetical protein
MKLSPTVSEFSIVAFIWLAASMVVISSLALLAALYFWL